MADTDMTAAAREAFLADLHVGVLSIQRDGKGPLALPIWYQYDDGVVMIWLSGDSVKTKVDEDPMVTAELLTTCTAAYVGDGDPKAPLASPLFADLSGLPPLLIHVGTAEILLDDARRLGERASASGVDITLEEWESMIHVWHAFGALLPEAGQAIDRIGEFLGERFGA